MRHIGIAWTVATVLLLSLGCSTRLDGGDSETHWVVCKTTADCHGGQTCEREYCVDPAAGDSGTSNTMDPAQSDGGTSNAVDATPAVPDGRPRIENPTGTCVAPDSGARRGYQSPEPGDVWLPDCKNPLKREYYRVFAQSETSAYVSPRPDGAFELVLPCNDATHPMRELVQRYSLCEAASDPATADRINHMAPAEALALTHYMHGVLIFEAEEGVPNANLRPFGIPSDVLDACDLHPSELSTDLVADCAAQRTAIDSGLEGPTFYSTAGELAPLLNELYGVAGCTRPERAGRVCTECGLGGGCGKTDIRCTRSCTSSAECTGAPAGQSCMLFVCGPVTGCI